MNNKDMTSIINNQIEVFRNKEGFNPDNVSDGYHTFGELYKHRIHLFIALCNMCYVNNQILNFLPKKDPGYKKYRWNIIKSKLHFDGTCFDGYFIIQLFDKLNGLQISYHLPNEYWDKCRFIDTVEKANEWDGHTSDDVLERLLKI